MAQLESRSGHILVGADMEGGKGVAQSIIDWWEWPFRFKLLPGPAGYEILGQACPIEQERRV